jgi:hypothetical protein
MQDIASIDSRMNYVLQVISILAVETGEVHHHHHHSERVLTRQAINAHSTSPAPQFRLSPFVSSSCGPSRQLSPLHLVVRSPPHLQTPHTTIRISQPRDPPEANRVQSAQAQHLHDRLTVHSHSPSANLLNRKLFIAGNSSRNHTTHDHPLRTHYVNPP